MSRRTTAPPPAKVEKVVIETFRPFDRIEQDRMRDDAPSCMNGSVRVRRYRITVEPVEEPPEVVHQRLQELWEKETNHHQRIPLLREAARLGYVLKGDMGAKGSRR